MEQHVSMLLRDYGSLRRHPGDRRPRGPLRPPLGGAARAGDDRGRRPGGGGRALRRGGRRVAPSRRPRRRVLRPPDAGTRRAGRGRRRAGSGRRRAARRRTPFRRRSTQARRRAIVGTAALSHGTGSSLSRLPPFGDELVVAVDAKDGRVVADGWVTETGVSPGATRRRCADAGVRRLLVTSTRRDGSLARPRPPSCSPKVLDGGSPGARRRRDRDARRPRRAARPRLRGRGRRAAPSGRTVRAPEAIAYAPESEAVAAVGS